MSRELLFSVTKKDFRIDTFRSGGKGGQNQNKVESGVRITHIESGAVGESREERDQPKNKKNAFLRCVNSKPFQAWLKKKAGQAMLSKEERRQAETRVDNMMREENLRVEYYEPR
ncbi:MAG TPA: peptide chain release factor-like protein [Desulfotomaculum sp.]|nr:peptide chain release factor-like protein [Desulfotomaculum sp.]